MYFDTSTLDWQRSYKLMSATVVPRPIAWVVTHNADSSTNAAPFSFFNYFAGFPPVVCIGMTDRANGPPDSLVNIRRAGEFVVNLVSEDLAEAMNTTAIEFPPGTSELAMAGLRSQPSRLVGPPRIAGSPVAYECKLVELIRVLGDTGYIVMASVAALHIDDDAVIDAHKCYVDTARLRLVGRMESPGTYLHTADRFAMRTLSVDEWRRQSESHSPIQSNGDKR